AGRFQRHQRFGCYSPLSANETVEVFQKLAAVRPALTPGCFNPGQSVRFVAFVALSRAYSMFALSSGRWQGKALRAALFPLIAGAAAISVAGCAADNNAYYAGSYSGSYPGSSPPTYVAQGPAVQMEADGLPVQTAPLARIRTMP